MAQVHRNVDLGGLGLAISGSGTYRIGGEFALEERLALDLVVGAQGVKRLEGLRVAGGTDFPAVLDVPIATDIACFKTAIDVRAKQVPMVAPSAARR